MYDKIFLQAILERLKTDLVRRKKFDSWSSIDSIQEYIKETPQGTQEIVTEFNGVSFDGEPVTVSMPNGLAWNLGVY